MPEHNWYTTSSAVWTLNHCGWKSFVYLRWTRNVKGKVFFFSFFSLCFCLSSNVPSQLYNDLHIFDTETLEWTRFQPTKLFPEARAGHTTNLVGNHTLVVFGGHCHKQKYSNSVFLFDIATMRFVNVLFRLTVCHCTIERSPFERDLFVVTQGGRAQK